MYISGPFAIFNIKNPVIRPRIDNYLLKAGKTSLGPLRFVWVINQYNTTTILH